MCRPPTLLTHCAIRKPCKRGGSCPYVSNEVALSDQSSCLERRLFGLRVRFLDAISFVVRADGTRSVPATVPSADAANPLCYTKTVQKRGIVSIGFKRGSVIGPVELCRKTALWLRVRFLDVISFVVRADGTRSVPATVPSAGAANPLRYTKTMQSWVTVSVGAEQWDVRDKSPPFST